MNSKNRKKIAFTALLVTTLAILGIMRIADDHLKNDLAPAGIVSLEFAADPESAQDIIQSWEGSPSFWAGFSMGMDFLFLAAYSATIAWGCLLVGKRLSNRWPLVKSTSHLVAAAVLVAGGLDIIENIALIKLIAGSTNAALPVIAIWCAVPKFLLVLIGVIYLLAGLVISRLIRKQATS